mmetsp:Transcript_15097/g.38387  ORF Transcript_15097/g.38387 Transcript_15097/m.38387 type:complete len:92 (-) Transcript_15097:939-1214(-)
MRMLEEDDAMEDMAVTQETEKKDVSVCVRVVHAAPAPDFENTTTTVDLFCHETGDWTDESTPRFIGCTTMREDHTMGMEMEDEDEDEDKEA